MNNESQQQQIPKAKLNLVVIVIVIYPTTRHVLPPLASLRTHTHTDWQCCCQSKSARQPGENRKSSALCKCWMENAILLTLCCTFNMATPCWLTCATSPLRCKTKPRSNMIQLFVWDKYAHIYIYINLNQLKSNCSAGFVGELSEKADN